jgi:hypothetical protein
MQGERPLLHTHHPNYKNTIINRKPRPHTTFGAAASEFLDIHALSQASPSFSMPEDPIHQPNDKLLKAEPVGELLGDPLWDEPLLFSLSEGALERILRYILNAEVSVTHLKERLGKIQAKPLQSKTMTLADRLREEGKLEGEREGILRGKREGQLRAVRTSVLPALEIRHGAYPEGIREAIEAMEDSQRLEALHESAFRSESLEAFAQML